MQGMPPPGQIPPEMAPQHLAIQMSQQAAPMSPMNMTGQRGVGGPLLGPPPTPLGGAPPPFMPHGPSMMPPPGPQMIQIDVNTVLQMQAQMLHLTSQMQNMQAAHHVPAEQAPRVHQGWLRNVDLPHYDGKLRKEETLNNWFMQMDALWMTQP